MIDAYDEVGDLDEAVDYATATTGKAIIFTGTTMIAGTGFFCLSDLKFLAEMGLLLTLLMTFNKFGALIVVPALVKVHPAGLPARAARRDAVTSAEEAHAASRRARRISSASERRRPVERLTEDFQGGSFDAFMKQATTAAIAVALSTVRRGSPPSVRAADAGADGKAGSSTATTGSRAKDLLPAGRARSASRRATTGTRCVPVDPEKFKQNYSKKFWDASEANAGKYDLDPGDLRPEGREDRQDAGLLLRLSVPEDRPEGSAGRLQDGVELRRRQLDGRGPGRDVHAQRHRHQRRVQAHQAVAAHQWRSSAATAARSTTPRTCAARACPTCSSRRTSTASAASPSASTTGTSQDKAWFYVPVDPPRAPRQRRHPLRSGRRPRHLRRRPELLRRQGRVLQVEARSASRTSSPRCSARSRWRRRRRARRPASRSRSPTSRAPTRRRAPRACPWLIVDNLVLVPRPVWVLEGESSDPYYNFGKVIMYMDKDMYRIYWKLVHNRAGEYFYNAMCAYHFSKSDDGTLHRRHAEHGRRRERQDQPRLPRPAATARSSSSASTRTTTSRCARLTHISD